MATNISYIDPRNTGDIWAAPAKFYPELFDAHLDIRQYRDQLFNLSVFGGGTLLGGEGNRNTYMRIASNSTKSVIWGAGTDGSASALECLDMTTLVGVRDYNVFPSSYEWVPCVSCLHPHFDNIPEPTQDVIAIQHAWKIISNNDIAVVPTDEMLYMKGEITDVLNTIARGAKVVTTSYHCAYWAMLMGRQVYLYQPDGFKYNTFKHQPITISDIEDVNKDTHSFDGVLEEYREINRNFYERVRNL